MPKIVMEFEIDANISEGDTESISDDIAEFANDQFSRSWCQIMSDEDYQRWEDDDYDEGIMKIETLKIEGCESHNLNGGA